MNLEKIARDIATDLACDSAHIPLIEGIIIKHLNIYWENEKRELVEYLATMESDTNAPKP